MRLRERLEIRDLADGVYDAHAGEQYQLQALADLHGEDAVLDWLRFGCRRRDSRRLSSPTVGRGRHGAAVRRAGGQLACRLPSDSGYSER
jgi:hypothetical protein